ncbi:MAG: BrnT family toxin [Desulfobacterales bacterium]|nr:BrnT family toxin [Desulfobacterales bacterium]
MEFDFDNRKSQINKKKQGIDFIEAQALWDDPDRIEAPARTIDEERFLIMDDS